MSGKIEKLLSQAKRDENKSSIICEERTFDNAKESTRAFSLIKAKLLDIDEWNNYAGISSYKLYDESGREFLSNVINVGVFVRISLTGSGKYDWVKVINIFESANEFIITVKPAFDPTSENIDKSIISHFFTDAATNNFSLKIEDETVRIYVIGLDEIHNTIETKNIIQTIRNVAVNLGSYLGIQRGEWEKFCRHFIELGSSAENENSE